MLDLEGCKSLQTKLIFHYVLWHSKAQKCIPVCTNGYHILNIAKSRIKKVNGGHNHKSEGKRWHGYNVTLIDFKKSKKCKKLTFSTSIRLPMFPHPHAAPLNTSHLIKSTTQVCHNSKGSCCIKTTRKTWRQMLSYSTRLKMFLAQFKYAYA